MLSVADPDSIKTDIRQPGRTNKRFHVRQFQIFQFFLSELTQTEISRQVSGTKEG